MVVSQALQAGDLPAWAQAITGPCHRLGPAFVFGDGLPHIVDLRMGLASPA